MNQVPQRKRLPPRWQPFPQEAHCGAGITTGRHAALTQRNAAKCGERWLRVWIADDTDRGPAKGGASSAYVCKKSASLTVGGCDLPIIRQSLVVGRRRRHGRILPDDRALEALEPLGE